MSFASSVPLALACCHAGIVAGWQGGTLTRIDEFERYLEAFDADLAGPPIVNLPARIATEADGEAKLALLEQHRAPLILSSLGDPSALIARVHGWGGRVIQDVTTMRHAEKAIAVGVDGLMLTCAGAGGHSGFLSPLAFVPAVRRVWDGLLIVAGGIADVHGVAASLALGGDLACMGTLSKGHCLPVCIAVSAQPHLTSGMAGSAAWFRIRNHDFALVVKPSLLSCTRGARDAPGEMRDAAWQY